MAKRKPVRRRRLSPKAQKKRVDRELKHREAARKRGLLDLALHMPIVAFKPGSLLREAVRIWWSPSRRIDRLTEAVRAGWGIEMDKLAPDAARFARRVMRSGKASSKAKATRAKVRLRLIYPLTEPRSKVVTIDRRFPGEVLGLCHDFYQQLYAEDEQYGGKPMSTNQPNGPLPLNRRAGPLIWGHDLSDLVFRGVVFKPLRKNKDGVVGEFMFEIDS
jgi:hypothetical protein